MGPTCKGGGEMEGEGIGEGKGRGREGRAAPNWEIWIRQCCNE